MAEEKDPETKKREKNLRKQEELKGLSLLNNIHKITPQIQQESDKEGVAIIKALGSSKIVQDSFLRLKGFFYDPIERKHIQYRNPVMNSRGLGNFISVISDINENIEFSNLDEKEIPNLAKLLFKQNYPYFTIYHKEYDLDRADFNLLSTILLTAIIASLHKAKGSGHRNVIRGVYSEGLLGRYFDSGEATQKTKSKLFDFSKLNPFKKSKGI